MPRVRHVTCPCGRGQMSRKSKMCMLCYREARRDPDSEVEQARRRGQRKAVLKRRINVYGVRLFDRIVNALEIDDYELTREQKRRLYIVTTQEAMKMDRRNANRENAERRSRKKAA